MNKQLTIITTGFIAMCAVVFGTVIGLQVFTNYMALVIGFIIMIMAIIIHQMGKTMFPLYVISIIMNAIATGFSLSGFYIYLETSIDISTLLAAGLFSFIVIVLFTMIVMPNQMKKYDTPIAVIVIIILYATTILLWVNNNDIFFSTLFFMMHIAYFFIVALVNVNEKRTPLRSASLASFGIYILVSAIVIIVVSEGDALEGTVHIGDLGRKDKNNKINK